MPIIRVDNYVDAYKIRAASANLHSLAGRDGNEDLTEFVNLQVLEGMDLGSGDTLVDIGCGDGRLLRKAANVPWRIGIVPTAEEKTRLEATQTGISFAVGLAQKLPLESESATRIVCNGVLLLMKSEDDVVESLREISRIATKGARIWIGEIPEVDEYAKHRMYRGHSVRGLLWFLLRNHGLRTFVGMCRQLFRAIFGKEQVVLNSARLYYSTPMHFIELAVNCGLRLESYFEHRKVERCEPPLVSVHRYNYIFRK
jgi:hypothetical protein